MIFVSYNQMFTRMMRTCWGEAELDVMTKAVTGLPKYSSSFRVHCGGVF